MRYLGLLCIAACATGQELTERERMLLSRIENLERRLAALERSRQPAPAAVRQAVAAPAPEPPAAENVSVSLNLDGYYAWNFNRPYNQMNALRAYDVADDGFSINQAGLIVERAPDVRHGRRVGARLDLMFGQATETLQGSPANERRPQVFRHIWQAYGTIVAPVGRGLTVDFGKFASSLGIEGNYTRDQINYSRSYWFSLLPFYHMGFRTTYPVTSKVNVAWWLTNGANQTEDFNGFKSHGAILNVAPSSNLSANLNYFTGQEQRPVAGRIPRGRTHIVDSYLTWHATDRLTLAAEADYVIGRVEPASAPERVTGGAGYLRYRVRPRFALAGRFAYLDDRGGLFSGTTQTLRDATFTATLDAVEGMQLRWEYRRDWSNRAFFRTSDPGSLKREQNTALLGLIWWFGGKPGPW